MDFQINYGHSIIFGNFNADMLIDTYDSMQLNNFVDSAHSYCVPYQATYHLRDLLDLCIVDDSIKITGFGQHGMAFLSTTLYRHNLIYIRYSIGIRHSDRFVMCQNFKFFNEEIFFSEIQSLDWSMLIEENSIDR